MVNIVARHMSSRIAHLIVAKRILHFVKGTLDFGIHLHPQTTSATLYAYSHDDWRVVQKAASYFSLEC